MKQKILVFVMIILVSGVYAKMPDYLPQAAELKKWEPAGTAQHVVGDDLFLLINGAAEIYHEYGFKQAITQGFQHKSQPSSGFNLEIYEMQNPAAAYGVYTFKTSDAGKSIDVGNEGLLEDYYINFWKGNFLVTVIGFDSKKETLAGIILAAKIVNAKIKKTGQKPELLQLLPKGDKYQLKPNGITYLKGNLALFNQYEFDSKDIFGLKEGVVANYKDFRFFVFQYKDAIECKKWFDTAQKYLETNPSYKDFSIKETSFSFKDNKNNPFYIQHYKQYILIIQGEPHDMDPMAWGTDRPFLNY
jgi:hypothetical protein